MDDGQAHYQEQDDPIQGETDSDSKERHATADIHRISRPCEHAAWWRAPLSASTVERLCQSAGRCGWRSSPFRGRNEGEGADHDPYRE